MGEIDVRLARVCKSFGGVAAVDGISLDVHRGEFLALLGPSGCGKSTLLNLIAGFFEPDEGEILVRKRSMVGVEPFQRDVGMVFQNYALFPHMTVRQNVEFGLEMRRVPRAERRARADEALALVKLAGLDHRYPDQLSGGQQQRVALARVIAVRPSVLLLDEPLAALDRQLREDMQVELRHLQKQVGITTIFVTHDQEEALTMADRIAVLRNGHVEQVGTPAEVYERPATSFVAGFIGLSNSFEGVVDGAERACLRTTEGEVHVPAAPRAGARMRLVVRPEKMRICRAAPPGANALPAELRDIVYLGTHTRYIACFATGKLVSVFQQNAGMGGDRDEPLRPGDAILVSWDAREGVLLDAAD
jgi:spermidine/putrescine ABC transporter ATP-binding subunit